MTSIQEFFLSEKIVNFSLAVVFGKTFGDLISSIISNMVMPLLSSVFGSINYQDLFFTINGQNILYGIPINYFIIFISSISILYYALVVPFSETVRLNEIKKKEKDLIDQELLKKRTDERDKIQKYLEDMLTYE